MRAAASLNLHAALLPLVLADEIAQWAHRRFKLHVLAQLRQKLLVDAHHTLDIFRIREMLLSVSLPQQSTAETVPFQKAPAE